LDDAAGMIHLVQSISDAAKEAAVLLCGKRYLPEDLTIMPIGILLRGGAQS